MDVVNEVTASEVLAKVDTIVRELMGDELPADVPIAADTSFQNDLELESIEFVALAEKLREAYGPEIDFAGWLSGMDLKEILGLRVGDLVDFIVRCKSAHTTA
jgi:acyl carrier protein